MIPRYEDPAITRLFSDANKVAMWDKVELAKILAASNLGLVEAASYNSINTTLAGHPFDLPAWYEREKKTHHDLGAYVELRQAILPAEVRHLFHQHMTSYDVVDTAFALILVEANALVDAAIAKYQEALGAFALRHRYTPMLARTHGQGAKLGMLGIRFLTYYAELRFALKKVRAAAKDVAYGRMSGAVGNYGGGLSPELEAETLSLLRLRPFYGSTQIIPRIVFAALAQSLALAATELEKQAIDLRLGARSGCPLWQEEFGKEQKGSTAMPHKRNPIVLEQMSGMAREGRAGAEVSVENMLTWEERAIEQSSAERISWPDLYHAVLRMLGQMTRVVNGLEVYPDNLLREIVEARGTYATDEAKNFLAEAFAKRGHDAAEAYPVVQLAAFNAFEPQGAWKDLRERRNASLAEAQAALEEALGVPAVPPKSIQTLIARALLEPHERLAATPEQVEGWNALLRELFADIAFKARWDELFSIPFLLKNEDFLFKRVLDA